MKCGVDACARLVGQVDKVAGQVRLRTSQERKEPQAGAKKGKDRAWATTSNVH
jgi:hypothetical protein